MNYWKLLGVFICAISAVLMIALFAACIHNLNETEKSLTHNYVKHDQIRNPKRLEL